MSELFDFSNTTMMSAQQIREKETEAVKALHKSLDMELQKLRLLLSNRERSIAITKLQEILMWLDEDLRQLEKAGSR